MQARQLLKDSKIHLARLLLNEARYQAKKNPETSSKLAAEAHRLFNQLSLPDDAEYAKALMK